MNLLLIRYYETFAGNNSELFKHKDFRNIMKAQVTNQETVNFNENETFCNSSSSSLFSCNKIGTSILIKSSAKLPTGYLFCEAHIFGFKAHGDVKALITELILLQNLKVFNIS